MAESTSSESEQIKLLTAKKTAYFTSYEMEKSQFIWSLENFCATPGQVGSCKTTPVFPEELDETSQCRWTLTLYPHGETEAKKEYLGLKLTMKKGPGNKEAMTMIELRLKTACDRVICCRTDDSKFTTNTVYSWEQLPKINHLRKILDDDVLVIDLDITCNVQEVNKYFEPEPPIAFLKMVDNYSALRKSSKLCDVVISVDGAKIPAHSVVLAARSPVFMAMFDHSTVEKASKTIEVPDVDQRTMQHLLDFVYSCELPNFDVQKAMDLLKAADKYDIEDLKEHCAIYLSMSLNIANVVDILMLADLHSSEQLKERAIDFICANKARFKGLENFNCLLDRGAKVLVDVLHKMSGSQ